MRKLEYINIGTSRTIKKDFRQTILCLFVLLALASCIKCFSDEDDYAYRSDVSIERHKGETDRERLERAYEDFWERRDYWGASDRELQEHQKNWNGSERSE